MKTKNKKYCWCNTTKEKSDNYSRAVEVTTPDFIEITMNYSRKIPKKKISIDACLVPEIFDLWRRGIRTTGCCCGHNFQSEYAYIGVVVKDIPKMKSLGYKVAPNESDLTREDSFYPKSFNLCEHE